VCPRVRAPRRGSAYDKAPIRPGVGLDLEMEFRSLVLISFTFDPWEIMKTVVAPGLREPVTIRSDRWGLGPTLSRPTKKITSSLKDTIPRGTDSFHSSSGVGRPPGELTRPSASAGLIAISESLPSSIPRRPRGGIAPLPTAIRFPQQPISAGLPHSRRRLTAQGGRAIQVGCFPPIHRFLVRKSLTETDSTGKSRLKFNQSLKHLHSEQQ